MGEMADLQMDLECDAWDEWNEGRSSFEDPLAAMPSHLWLANDGGRYVIAKMERRHIRTTLAMLGRWVRDRRGSDEAEIVGAQRWKNLLKRFEEA